MRAAYAKWVPVIGCKPLPIAAADEHAVQAHRIDLLAVAGEHAALIEMVPEGNVRLIENVALYRRLGYPVDREERFRGGMTVHMSRMLGADQSR